MKGIDIRYYAQLPVETTTEEADAIASDIADGISDVLSKFSNTFGGGVSIEEYELKLADDVECEVCDGHCGCSDE
jgi:hypothetical protein